MDQRTAESLRNWEGAAAGWERNAERVARTSVEVTSWLLEHLAPRPGETWLELGAGPGDFGFAIAERIGPAGRLISTDFAAGMVDAARRRAAAAGIDNAEVRQMDAQAIDLPDESVDGAVHRFGPFLLPDPAASARHVRRVLRPGGRYATAGWGRTEHNPLFPLIGRTMVEAGFMHPPSPTAGEGSPDLSDPDVMRALLEDAGFDDVLIEELETPFEFASFDELWVAPSELAGPVAVALRKLDTENYERARNAIRRAVEPFRSGDGYVIGSRALCALARGPS